MLSRISATSSFSFVRTMATAITHDWVHYIRTAQDPKPKCERLTLFGHNLCPFVERVRLGLAEKQVPYDSVELDLSQRPDWYYAMNPLGKVPTVQFANGSVLYESDLILEVIDRIYRENSSSLFPEDPVANAQLKLKMRQLTKFVNLYYAVARMKGEWQETAASLKQELMKLEAQLGDKPFFGGEKLNALDFMIFPHLERVLWTKDTHLKQTFSLFGGDQLKKLPKYYERVRSLKHLKKAFTEHKAHLSLIQELKETGGYQLRLPLMKA